MICPECGYETSGNFCSNCGALLTAGMSPDTLEHTEPSCTEHEPIRLDREQNRAEREPDRRERRGGSRRKEKSGKTSASRNSAKSGPAKKEARLEHKEKKLRENRIKNLESEVERLSAQERLRDRRRHEQNGEKSGDSGQDLGEMAAKGAAGAVVAAARAMQLVSFLLMGSMVVVMARAFFSHSEGLGDIRYVISEQNYGLALYASAAGLTLFMGVIWCLWILSRKGAGGGFRLKKYDTGRGMLPFIICGIAVFAAGPALAILPHYESMTGVWQGIVRGAFAALTAVQEHRAILLLCSGAGAVLSFIRRILRV